MALLLLRFLFILFAVRRLRHSSKGAFMALDPHDARHEWRQRRLVIRAEGDDVAQWGDRGGVGGGKGPDRTATLRESRDDGDASQTRSPLFRKLLPDSEERTMRKARTARAQSLWDVPD